jgi:glycosyltransferase involved in cell wall biosynthesis
MSSNPTPRETPRTGLAVGLCTYKRRTSLERTLAHVAIAAKALDSPPCVIVVDNDGQDPEVRQSVERFATESGLAVHYLVEPKPGISAARNAIFDQAETLRVRFVAMIDDDEWPSREWLAALLAEQAATSASVVGGPVRPVFPANSAGLQRYARFWSVDRQYLQGKPFVFCTCNFLIDMQAVAGMPRPLFDEEFGLSGGGDTVFFRSLFFAGHPMAWTDVAYVHEEVPPARASFAWMRQRRYRVGNHAVRWESIESRGRSLAKTIGLAARLPIYPLLRREPEMPFVGWLFEYDKLRGRMASHLGDVFVEYGRASAPGEKACG